MTDEETFLAALCAQPTCADPIVRGPEGWAVAGTWARPQGHDHVPRPGTVALASVWDCDEAAAGTLGSEFITIEHGDLTCICGNDAANEGFQMSDGDGAVPESEDEQADAWDGTHYRCGRCGRVIDQDTARVVALGADFHLDNTDNR